MIDLSISETILSYISGFGILQGILLSLLIYFHKKSDRTVNKYLALYILLVSLVMTLPFIFKTIKWQNSFFVHPVPLLIGPLLYLYLKSFKEVITWKKAWPHFIMYVLYHIPAYWNASRFAEMYPDNPNVPPELIRNPVTAILNYLKLTQAVIYYFLARHTLINYQRSIRQVFSETSKIDLQWGRLLVNGNIMIVFCAIVMYTVMIKFPQYFDFLLVCNMAIATPYIYLVTYKGVMQPTIWQLKPNMDKELIEGQMEKAEHMGSHISQPAKNIVSKPPAVEAKISEIVSKITLLMEKEKLYQETELTLQDLADKIKSPSYQVSQAINDGMKKNFYDLVNSYRVEEAKRLLLDPGNMNYTVLSVGFEAGFNSKTTFNTVFKKFTGLTPTDFRQRERVITPA